MLENREARGERSTLAASSIMLNPLRHVYILGLVCRHATSILRLKVVQPMLQRIEIGPQLLQRAITMRDFIFLLDRHLPISVIRFSE